MRGKVILKVAGLVALLPAIIVSTTAGQAVFGYTSYFASNLSLSIFVFASILVFSQSIRLSRKILLLFCATLAVVVVGVVLSLMLFSALPRLLGRTEAETLAIALRLAIQLGWLPNIIGFLVGLCVLLIMKARMSAKVGQQRAV